MGSKVEAATFSKSWKAMNQTEHARFIKNRRKLNYNVQVFEMYIAPGV